MDTIKSFLQGDYASIFWWLLGVFASFIITVIFLKKQKPVYYCKTRSIIDTSKELKQNLEIKYNGNVVTNLRVASFLFYNKGNKEIRRNDISSDFPLSIKGDNSVHILDYSIPSYSRDELSLSISLKEKNCINMTLDNDEAFEKQDGFILNVYYTSEEKKDKWTFGGRIKGLKKGIKKQSTKNNERFDRVLLVIIAIVLVYAFTPSRISNDPFISNIITILSSFLIGSSLAIIRFVLLNVPKWAKKSFFSDFLKE